MYVGVYRIVYMCVCMSVYVLCIVLGAYGTCMCLCWRCMEYMHVCMSVYVCIMYVSCGCIELYVCMYVYWVYIGGVWNLLLLIDQVRSLALDMAVASEWQRWLGKSLLSAYSPQTQSVCSPIGPVRLETLSRPYYR